MSKVVAFIDDVSKSPYWRLADNVGEWLIPFAGLVWAAFVYCGGIVNVAGGAI